MKISLITATYNSIQHLSAVLECIKQQTFPNLEHIIVDGGSTDGTVEYLKQSKFIGLFVSEPDKGIYDALNKGINMATGDIIGFLHSDDILASPQTIERITHAFSNPTPFGGGMEGASVIYGDLVFVDQQDTSKVVRYWKSKPFKPELLNNGWMPPHPTIFMRREVYEKHGLFNIQLKCAADYDHILRVFRDQSLTIEYLPEVITRMRVGGVSTKGIKNLINKKKEDYLVLKANRMPFPIWILAAKNIRKIPQLVFRKKI
jgi:glycosyltransferase